MDDNGVIKLQHQGRIHKKYHPKRYTSGLIEHGSIGRPCAKPVAARTSSSFILQTGLIPDCLSRTDGEGFVRFYLLYWVARDMDVVYVPAGVGYRIVRRADTPAEVNRHLPIGNRRRNRVVHGLPGVV